MKYLLQVVMALCLTSLFAGCKKITKQENGSRSEDEISVDKANIIIIVHDQHRWGTLGKINPQVITATLDSLAETGIYFSQAVCQAQI